MEPLYAVKCHCVNNANGSRLTCMWEQPLGLLTVTIQIRFPDIVNLLL